MPETTMETTTNGTETSQKDIDDLRRTKDAEIQSLRESNTQLAQIADYARNSIQKCLEDVDARFKNYLLAQKLANTTNGKA